MAVFAVTGIVMMAITVMLTRHGSGWTWSELAFAATIALVGAGCVTLVHWLISGSLEQELRRLRQHVQDLAQLQEPPPAPLTRPWLSELQQTVDRTFGQLRIRADRGHALSRTLEARLRIAQVQRAQTDAALLAVSEGVIITDAFNELIFANPLAADLFRFDADLARAQPIDRVLSDPTIVKLIAETRAQGAGVPERRIEHAIGHDGGHHVYELALRCVLGAEQEVLGVITVLRDITREKEMAELRSDFVCGVSHELRTPLSSIKAYIEMLVDGEADGEETRQEFYNIIQSETNRLCRLIDNMLNISRIESGIVRGQHEQMRLAGVIREVMEIMQPQARARRIRLRSKPVPADAVVAADHDMICQAMINLVGNAIKYTLPGGRVTLSVRTLADRGLVQICVTDTGLGIPPEAMPHLFDKFYRVPEHKQLARGTGLGLNLVKHVIETVHRGHVLVDSEVGRGSTFSITLPQSQSQGLTVGPRPSPEVGAPA
jgi:two-component system, OmpR family, phosphate regulon sensor histidine kinase PhoR